MAEYANKKVAQYVPEKDLKESILNKNPVPINILEAASLHDFFRKLKEEQHKTRELALDITLLKLQQKTRTVMGPSSRLWVAFENALHSKQAKVEITIEDIQEHLLQSIIFLGKTFNGIAYQRRLNVLQSVMKESNTKQTIRDQTQVLQGDCNGKFFGSKFEEHLTGTIKSKKKCKNFTKNN